MLASRLALLVACLAACGRTTDFTFDLALSTITEANVNDDQVLIASNTVAGGGEQSWKDFTAKVKESCGAAKPQLSWSQVVVRVEATEGGLTELDALIGGRLSVVIADRPLLDKNAVRLVVAETSAPKGASAGLDPRPNDKSLDDKVIEGDIFMGLEAESAKRKDEPFRANVHIALSIKARC